MKASEDADLTGLFLSKLQNLSKNECGSNVTGQDKNPKDRKWMKRLLNWSTKK